MFKQDARRSVWLLFTSSLLLISLACGLGSTTAEPTSPPQPPTAPPTMAVATTEPAAPTEAGTAVNMHCEGPVTEVSFDTPVESEIVGGGEPFPHQYFCIVVPNNVPPFTVKITGLTAILNLYVGYPDLDTLQNGGQTFWQSEELGTVDKTATVRPLGSREFVQPGTYYIEVSPYDSNDSSPFTLTVTAP